MANNDIQVPTEHEFDPSENEVFSGLSGAMRFVAAVTIILGILFVIVGVFSLSSLIDAIINLGQGVCMILIGAWLYGAGTHFKDIVISEGNDITNLMMAIKKLKNVYTFQAWLFAIAIALVVLGIIFAVIAAAPHATH